jgi:hypothetical protein
MMIMMMIIIAAITAMMLIFTVTIITNLLFLFATEVKFLRYSQGSNSSKLLNWTGMDKHCSLMTQLTLCLYKNGSKLLTLHHKHCIAGLFNRQLHSKFNLEDATTWFIRIKYAD